MFDQSPTKQEQNIISSRETAKEEKLLENSKTKFKFIAVKEEKRNGIKANSFFFVIILNDWTMNKKLNVQKKKT